MAALPQAPSDLRLNQRLAALHTRRAFRGSRRPLPHLQSVYSEAGYPEEATRYGELADRYEQRSSLPATPAVDLSMAAPETDSEEYSRFVCLKPVPAAPAESAEQTRIRRRRG